MELVLAVEGFYYLIKNYSKMIYLPSGLPVTRIFKANKDANTCTVEAYGGISKFHDSHEKYDRLISDLRADDGINEIHKAVDNPSSYQPDEDAVLDYFTKYCK